MHHEVFWFDEERTIVCQRFLRGFTLADVYHGAETSAQMLATVDHPVDIIIEAHGIPKMAGIFQLAQHVNRIVPPNQRLVVGVGTNNLLRSMVEISSKVAPKATENIHFVDTLDDALALIESYRAHLKSSV
jgi:hypothetical protein